MGEGLGDWLTRMPEFETGPGQSILPDVHVTLRLHGDRFGRLFARSKLELERPFDGRFAKWLLQVASYQLRAFSDARLAFVSGDELSVLFGVGPEGFGPGGYRFAIRAASQATARLSLLMGEVATFYPRIYQLPSLEWMKRYFLWRQASLQSYAVDRHCRFALERSGLDEIATRRVLADLSDAEKLEILTEHGVDFEATPAWQRRGSLVWRKADAAAGAPLLIDTSLPVGDAYADAIARVAEQ